VLILLLGGYELLIYVIDFWIKNELLFEFIFGACVIFLKNLA
jgi:hypothetical protein